MKNPQFRYHRPASLDQALELLSEHGDDAKILAGGQSLLPVMALRLGHPEHIVDIGRLDELTSLDLIEDGVRIGAMVRHAQAEHSQLVADHAPLVAAALPHVGHRAIRNRGTVVGSIAHADPAAELPAVCLATDAVMHIASAQGTRLVPAHEFFRGPFMTAIEPHELLVEVRFPAWPATATGTVVEISRRHSDYAMVGLACSLELDDGIVARAALAFFGVGATAQRVSTAEAALVGKAPTTADIAAAADIVQATLEPHGDVHATADYRRHIAAVLTRNGLNQLTQTIGAPA